MICSRCHKEISDQAVFCTECGQRVGASTELLTPTTFTPANYTPAPLTPPALTPPPSQASAFEPSPVSQVSAPVPALSPATPLAPAAPLASAAPAAAATIFVPASYDSGYTGTPFTGYPQIEESTFYHIDATECYDFEGLRGMSIVMLIVSVLSVVGILMPLPLTIASLVTACNGVGIREPAKAKQAFERCRLFLIISVCLIAFYILLFIGTVFILGAIEGFLPNIS